MNNQIKILFVEDVAEDLELIQRALKKGEISFVEKKVDTNKDFIDAIQNFIPDIILSDFKLPLFNGMEALQLRQKYAPETPFILVTGPNNEETAVECMKAGADDYILKDNLTRLSQALISAISKHNLLKYKKQAELALHESEELFRTAFENAASGVCLINSDLNFANVNLTFCSMIGFCKEEILQKQFLDFTFKKDLAISQKNISKLITGKVKNAHFEKRFVHKNGDVIWTSISAGVVRNPINNSIYCVLYVQDISAWKITEEQLKIAKEKAEESDRLKTSFLHNMSHEIRTPMNAIIGFSDLLSLNMDNKPKLEYFINIIKMRSEDLLDIINEILDIARIESGYVSIHPESFCLNSFLIDIYNYFLEYRKKLNKENIVFTIQIEEAAKKAIFTDKVKLKQILVNLINNAFKFTEKGEIAVCCSMEKNNSLKFSVKDTGIGIPQNQINTVFERFAQIEDKIKTHGGTGLGLSIAKGLTQILGGNIWVKSELNHGSTFLFTIPLVNDSYEEKQIKKPDIDLETIKFPKSKKILIVEDDSLNAELLKEFILSTGTQVQITTLGKEAILMEKSFHPDLVLLDIQLPDINGYKVAELMKKENPDIKIIVQTAYAGASDKIKALEAGCDDYISKPIKRSELFSKLNFYLKDPKSENIKI